jgi:hypothetical protein
VPRAACRRAPGSGPTRLQWLEGWPSSAAPRCCDRRRAALDRAEDAGLYRDASAACRRRACRTASSPPPRRRWSNCCGAMPAPTAPSRPASGRGSATACARPSWSRCCGCWRPRAAGPRRDPTARAEPEWCDAEVMRRLRRRTLARARDEIAPVDAATLGRGRTRRRTVRLRRRRRSTAGRARRGRGPGYAGTCRGRGCACRRGPRESLRHAAAVARTCVAGRCRTAARRRCVAHPCTRRTCALRSPQRPCADHVPRHGREDSRGARDRYRRVAYAAERQPQGACS